MQTEGWSARSRSDEVLGGNAKMNLQQQFERSVVAEECSSTPQVCLLNLCLLPDGFATHLCTLSCFRMGAVRAVPFSIPINTICALSQWMVMHTVFSKCRGCCDVAAQQVQMTNQEGICP